MDNEFDKLVNGILTEKFGAPSLKSRRRVMTPDYTPSINYAVYNNPNTWKDPLNRRHMGMYRAIDRKKPGWVPRSHQTDVALPLAQNVLNIAKDADQGIWKISPAQAVVLARKYHMHVPDDETPTKRLGSTGIIMWRRTKGLRRPQLYLVKYDRTLRSGVRLRKDVHKLKHHKKKGKIVFPGSFKSVFKTPKPQKPVGPMFEPGSTGL